MSISLAIPRASAYYPQTKGPPFFKLNMIIPNNVEDRMVWSTAIATEWAKLGIDMSYEYMPFTLIEDRRRAAAGTNTTPFGAGWDQGGWDTQTERDYYDTITPNPGYIFGSWNFPPGGENYGMINYTAQDQILKNYAAATTDQQHTYWMNQWEQWYVANVPMLSVFYPKDVFAINPKMQGYEIRDGDTYEWDFYPHPEYWTIPGKNSAVFAVWQPEAPLLPPYAISYADSDVFGPVHNQLYEYQNWQNKTLIPALATDYTVSSDGLTWVINLRQGVTWHDGWPFNATDVKFTLDLVMNDAYASVQNSELKTMIGGPDNVKITGPYQITITMPTFNFLAKEYVLATVAMLPWHAYKDLGPDQIGYGGLSPANTWQGSYKVAEPNGTMYTAYGPIGTGPWIAMGYDPVKQVYSYARNPHYWQQTPGNIQHFYVEAIQSPSAVIAAMKAGEVDDFDTSYGIASLVSTIDPSWGKLVTSDSYKWQHIWLNNQNPIIGTGVDTPLGMSDPSRAEEGAVDVRMALNLAIPRDAICTQIENGYCQPGVTLLPRTSPEYNTTILQPWPYNISEAMGYMEKAGYTYSPAATATTGAPSFMDTYGAYVGILIAAIVIVAAYLFAKARSKKASK